MFSKFYFKFNILGYVNVTLNNPLLAQVGLATSQFEGSTLRKHSICTKLCHQRGKSTLVFRVLRGQNKEHVHEEGMGLPSRIPCFTPMFSPLKPTSKGRISLSKANMHNKGPIVGIIANRRASIFGTWRRIYSSTLHNGGYRSSPTVPPDGVKGVPMDAVAVETTSIMSQKSARSRKKLYMVIKA